jgi:hypothetical protein
MSYLEVYHQRMSPDRFVGDPPVPDQPVISVVAVASEVTEGSIAAFAIRRAVNINAGCSVRWTAVSSGGAGDLTGTTSGTTTFADSNLINTIQINVRTVERSGVQGDRTLTVTLSNATGCGLDPLKTFALATIQDKDVTPPVDPLALPIAPGVLPTPLRTFNVNSKTDFLNLYNSAIPGDQINITANINLGGLTLDRDGESYSKPIIITTVGSTSPSTSAYLGGKLTIVGKHNIVYNVRGRGQLVELQGEGARVIFMKWDVLAIKGSPPTYPFVLTMAGRGQFMEGCEIPGCDSQGVVIKNSARACGILNNHLHDFNESAISGSFRPIQVGEDASVYSVLTEQKDRHHVGGNCIWKCNKNTPEIAAIRAYFNYTYVYRNDCDNAKNIELFGKDCRAESNRTRGSDTDFGLTVYGKGTVVNSHINAVYGTAPTAVGNIRLATGDFDSAGPGSPSAGQSPSANTVKLIGTTGNIQVGVGSKLVRAKAISIEGKVSGTVSNTQGGTVEYTTVATPSETIKPDPPLCAVGADPPRMVLLKNPFSKRSNQHRPFGKNVKWGIARGIDKNNIYDTNPTYPAPTKFFNEGDLSPFTHVYADIPKSGNVGSITAAQGDPFVKYTHYVTKEPLPTRAKTKITRAAKNYKEGIPATGQMELLPENSVTGDKIYNTTPAYPDVDGTDGNLILYPENGEDVDIAVWYYGLYKTGNYAEIRRVWGLQGLDYPEKSGDQKGAGASRCYWPMGVLRGYELTSSPPKIQHVLQVAVSRLGGSGNAPPGSHILNQEVVWPAYGADSIDADDNKGWLAYGTRFGIPPWLRKDEYRNSTNAAPYLGVALNLTAIGKALFDCFAIYGGCIVDGHKDYDDATHGVMKFRTDQGVTDALETSVDNAMKSLLGKTATNSLCFLFPAANPRKHKDDGTDLHTDGLYYYGGGGKLYDDSINTAWDV